MKLGPWKKRKNSEAEQKWFFSESRLALGGSKAPAHASAAEGRGEERTALPDETSFSISVPGRPFRVSQ